MKILVTGGTGYIGSHTVLSLQEAGLDIGRATSQHGAAFDLERTPALPADKPVRK